eukprot:5602456-Alexandrium_andersonii.AAC.1
MSASLVGSEMCIRDRRGSGLVLTLRYATKWPRPTSSRPRCAWHARKSELHRGRALRACPCGVLQLLERSLQ